MHLLESSDDPPFRGFWTGEVPMPTAVTSGCAGSAAEKQAAAPMFPTFFDKLMTIMRSPLP